MKSARFDVYQDTAGAWRWRLVAANGRGLASGEAHTRAADAWRAVDTVATTAGKATRWPMDARSRAR